MKLRELPWIALRTAAGVCALFVSLHGLWNLYGLDFRIDTLISVLYCLLPFSSFFIFLFVKAPKLEVSLHALIAIGYLTAFSMLNWRTCVELGYCGAIASIVWSTFRIGAVLAAFAVVLFTGSALLLETLRTPARQP